METKTTIIQIFICVSFALLSALNIYKLIQQDSRTKKQLTIQNRSIIFVNSSDLNIKEDCYPPDDFFKMHNSGKDPREQEDSIDYKRYHQKADLYM